MPVQLTHRRRRRVVAGRRTTRVLEAAEQSALLVSGAGQHAVENADLLDDAAAGFQHVVGLGAGDHVPGNGAAAGLVDCGCW